MTHNIIDTINATPIPDITLEESADLLRLAKIGDRSAAFTLLRLYMGPLVKEASRVARTARSMGYGTGDTQEEAFSDAVQVFFRVVERFDADRGMRGFGAYLTRTLRVDETLNARPGIARVPFQTLIRRTAAIKAAGGDIDLARRLAPQHGISRETFDAVTRVFEAPEGLGGSRRTETSEGGTEKSRDDRPTPPPLQFNEPGYVRVEDLQDAARALDALDFTSRLIVESAFGLNGQPQQSNAEIGDSLGMSRWAVQRRIDAAMLTMKQALTNPNEDQE